MVDMAPSASFAGMMHFYFNPSCETVQFTGVFPYPTGTQFILPALSALDPSIFSSYYANGTMPPIKTFPFSSNPECLARCGGSDGSQPFDGSATAGLG